MVVPLLENYRKSRPKWRFRTSEFHYPTVPLCKLARESLGLVGPLNDCRKRDDIEAHINRI